MSVDGPDSPPLSECGVKRRRLDDESEDEDYHAMLDVLRGSPDGVDNTLTNNEIRKLIVVNKAWWTAAPEGDLLKHVASRFGACADGRSIVGKLEDGTLSSVDLVYVKDKEMLKRIRLHQALRVRGLLESAGSHETGIEDLTGAQYATDLGIIQECVQRAYLLLMSDLMMRKALDRSVDEGCPTLVDPFNYVPLTEGKFNDFQSFYMFLLRLLHEKRYRRYTGAVYEQIESPYVENAAGKFGKWATHSWRRVCDIKEFVIRNTSKEETFAQWQNMLVGNSLERVVKLLSETHEPEFAELHPHRLWHAFHNGLYYVETQSFHKWGSSTIPSDIVACKYHDQPFNTEILDVNWMDVPAPHLQDILDYQFQVDGKEEGVKDEETQARIIMWLYALMGRTLYEVNQKDKWQIIPFIVGRAGTGKSLLLKAVGWFFNDEDVETLANNSQKGFGLETLIDKLMWRCYEVKNDFSLDQAQLQSMISGEPVSIMRKNKIALSVLWKVPGILAGNEAANWVDNSGSMSRRIVMAYFDRRVSSEKVDPHLDVKIRANIGNFLHKAASAYHAAVTEFGKKDIWSTFKDPETGEVDTILPRYFHYSKIRLQIMTHPLVAFLRNDATIQRTDQSQGMPFSRFKQSANNYMLKEGHKNFAWKEDKYKSVFDDMQITKIKIDARFLEARGLEGTISYMGCDYGVGEEWLLGVTENNDTTEL
jgi:hypothetical protein